MVSCSILCALTIFVAVNASFSERLASASSFIFASEVLRMASKSLFSAASFSSEDFASASSAAVASMSLSLISPADNLDARSFFCAVRLAIFSCSELFAEASVSFSEVLSLASFSSLECASLSLSFKANILETRFFFCVASFNIFSWLDLFISSSVSSSESRALVRIATLFLREDTSSWNLSLPELSLAAAVRPFFFASSKSFVRESLSSSSSSISSFISLNLSLKAFNFVTRRFFCPLDFSSFWLAASIVAFSFLESDAFVSCMPFIRTRMEDTSSRSLSLSFRSFAKSDSMRPMLRLSFSRRSSSFSARVSPFMDTAWIRTRIRKTLTALLSLKYVIYHSPVLTCRLLLNLWPFILLKLQYN